MTSLTRQIVRWIAAAALVVSTGCSGGTGDDTNSGWDIQFRGGDVAGPDDRGGSEGDSIPAPDCKRDSDCPTGRPFCDPNLKICVACRNNEHCTAALSYCHPATHVCVECIMDHQCGSARYCLDGSCSDSVCFPGRATCVGNAVHICSPDGMNPSATVIACGDQKCHQGKCLECTPSARECKGNLVIQCDSQGSGFAILDTCADGKDCIGGQCLTCYPGGKKCEGQMAYQCRVDGSVFDFLEDCSLQGKNCVMGTCISPCASDLKENTNAGCEFYAVDLHNAWEGEYDAQNAQFAIIVSNTSAVHAAEVTLTLPDGTTEVRSVAASSVHKFKPKPTWGITGNADQLGFGPACLLG